jgi:hypothetical protein
MRVVALRDGVRVTELAITALDTYFYTSKVGNDLLALAIASA